MLERMEAPSFYTDGRYSSHAERSINRGRIDGASLGDQMSVRFSITSAFRISWASRQLGLWPRLTTMGKRKNFGLNSMSR